ncbi:hypothetical protein EXE46_14730 [Halorubrum sp. GN11_10-6_MGM]|nr:hypothetical protein EXE46_14730 [Halorubrum sp. GN11_10-6_MGM]
MIRWAEYVRAQPAEVRGPQQNAVVNGKIEGAQAVDVSAEEKRAIREFADDVLEAERGAAEPDEE